MGVRVLLNTPVTELGKGKVTFSEGVVETPNLIWAAGVAASPLLSSLETEQDKTGRVKVNEDLSIPGHPDIFVLGDAAHFEQDGTALPALAPVAIQQGKYIAELLKKEASPEKRKAFQYIDKGTMATVGRAKAVADIRGFKFSGFFAWLLWCFVHILFLIGFRNRFKVFVEWIWFYFTFKRGVRIITKRFSE
jgi:NADH dehydrogenase